MKDNALTSEFAGSTVVEERLIAEDWYDQSSENYHFGLPQNKGLWVKRIDQEHGCEIHTAWLFILLFLKDDKKIKSVETKVFQVFNDASMDEIDIPLFQPDYEYARKECRAILLPDTVKKLPETGLKTSIFQNLPA